MKLTAACIAIFWPALLFAQMEAKLNASDGAAADEFGSTVAIDDSLLISGSPRNNTSVTDCGSAYIFRHNGISWTEEQMLTALDAATGDRFGYSVDIKGNVAIVGAPFDDDLGSNSGSAYIFRFNGFAWIQEYKLIAFDGNAGDEYGHSVSINDTVAVVGAYRSNNGNPGNGAVYVYRYNGISWNQMQKLTAPAAQIDDFFGYSVDLHKDRIIAGCYQDDDMGVNSGSAFVFQFNGTTWVQEQKLLPANGTAGDHFGFSVSINDTLALIGAYAKNTAATASGAAYVFSRTGSTWTQQQQLTASDGLTDDWFGFSVSISGRTLTCGAFHNDDLGSESGSAYLFRYNGSTWIPEMNLRASDGAAQDNFGYCVSVSGNTIAIGSPLNDDNGSASGSVYTYDLCKHIPMQELCMVTVDNNFNDILLLWEKPTTTLTSTYNIYRNSGSGPQLIYNQPYNLFSEHLDNTVNVDAQSYSYHLTTTNHCGVESAAGTVHSTMHLTTTPGTPGQVTLNWTPQTGFVFPFYRIWRDTAVTSNYVLIFATLNTQFAYTDNALAVGSPANYYMEVQRTAGSCNSGNTSRSAAYSNASDPFSVSVNEIGTTPLELYPNPANEYIQFQIPDYNGEALTVDLFDNGGRLVYSTRLSDKSGSIYVGNFPAGFYFVQLRNKNTTQFARLMIVR